MYIDNTNLIQSMISDLQDLNTNPISYDELESKKYIFIKAAEEMLQRKNDLASKQ